MFDYTVLLDVGSTVFFLVRPVKKETSTFAMSFKTNEYA